MYTYNLGAHAEHSDDGVKRDMELICNREGCDDPHICDIEHEDEIQTLGWSIAGHYTQHHGGAGNFRRLSAEGVKLHVPAEALYDAYKALEDGGAYEFFTRDGTRVLFQLEEEPQEEAAPAARSFNNHTNDIDDWCRWSTVKVSENYSDNRCPAGCRASRIIEADA